jgi:putative DNA primase/helicase
MSTFGRNEHLRVNGTKSVRLLSAADIAAEPIRWLWDGFLACGKLHLLAGPAGTGKTSLAMAMAAVITQGGKWPDGTDAQHGTVLIWSGEDGLADSLKPRLMANRGDPNRVYFVHSVADGERKRPFDPATDMEQLTEAAGTVLDLRLVIIDPVVSAVAGDSHKNAEVRRGLQPLVDLGAKINCAVLGISHFTKGTQGRDPTERVTGSLAFAAFARVVLATAKPIEEGGKRRMVRTKSNIGPDGGGFDYDLIQVTADAGPPAIFGQQVVWGRAITGSARDLLSEVEAEPGNGYHDSPALKAALTFLRDVLADGPILVSELKTEARDAGHSWPTIRRGQDKLGIRPQKSGMAGGWVWALPQACFPEHAQESPKVLMLKGVGALTNDGNPMGADGSGIRGLS